MGYLETAMLVSGIGMEFVAVAILTRDLALEIRYRGALSPNVGPIQTIPKPRWRTAAAFAMLAWAPLMIALGFAARAVR